MGTIVFGKVLLDHFLLKFQLCFQNPDVVVLCIHMILVVAEEDEVLSKAGREGRLQSSISMVRQTALSFWESMTWHQVRSFTNSCGSSAIFCLASSSVNSP